MAAILSRADECNAWLIAAVSYQQHVQYQVTGDGIGRCIREGVVGEQWTKDVWQLLRIITQ